MGVITIVITITIINNNITNVKYSPMPKCAKWFSQINLFNPPNNPMR